MICKLILKINMAIIQLVIILTSVVTSLVGYQYLPELIPTHWNYLGQVDGYGSKLGTMIAFPALILLFFLLLRIVPSLDPLKKNIVKFQKDYNNMISVFMLFFLLLQYQVILWSLGIQISPNYMFPITLGLLFFTIGNMLGKAKRNWTFGIKTPWTLSSENVWRKTHDLGKFLFKLSLPIFIVSLLIPNITFLIVIGYILAITFYLILYSFLEFKKEQGKN